MKPIEAIVFNYQRTHERAISVVNELSDDHLKWRPNLKAPSIGFHIWHMARWADDLFETIKEPGNQIWQREGLAEIWGLIPSNLGQAETGAGMGDDMSANLGLPPRDEILDYVRRAFSAANEAVSSISESSFYRPGYSRGHGEEQPIGDIVVTAITHNNRHLGMMEALRGLLDMPGTATV